MKLLYSSLALLALALPIFSQQKPEGLSADDVVREYNSYSIKADWQGMSSLLHPDSLREFRKLFATMQQKDADMLKAILDIKTVEEFNSITDAQVFERLFKFVNKFVPEVQAAMSGMQVSVIGSVEESPEVRHFVYRAKFSLGSTSISSVDIYSLKRYQDTWRVLMKDDEIQAIAASLKEMEAPQQPVKTTPTKKRTTKRN